VDDLSKYNMMETMITVEEALQLINKQVSPLKPVQIDLKDAVGLTMAEDIFADLSIPAFPQSSMDGYAFAYEEGATTYTIVGEVAAGNHHLLTIEKGTAVRIFTGAAVPSGADTVLMQEKAQVTSGQLVVLDEKLKQGNNVRPIGAEMDKGSVALTKGTLLSPAAIGFLAGIGTDKVIVYPKPKVGILVTGNELQMPGTPLTYGQVYESNSYTLIAALHQMQLNQIKVLYAPDDLEQLTNRLNELLADCDVVLITGGVSVGDYDFTLASFQQCKVHPVFHKIKQKPGKPLLFGKKESKLIFGLPGNPASVLTCFYEYVLPAIGLLMQINCSLRKIEVPIQHDFNKPIGLTQFLKAVYDGKGVSVQTGQESFKLSSYAKANCLAIFPEQCSQVSVGEIITIHLLPHF
jgi:molybdopterin molybdotransferase